METSHNSGLFYSGSDIKVRLGDKVRVRSFFRWHDGIIAYLPGVSPFRKELHEAGADYILIRRPQKGDFLQKLYEPDYNEGRLDGSIQFIERGGEGAVTETEPLEDD